MSKKDPLLIVLGERITAAFVMNVVFSFLSILAWCVVVFGYDKFWWCLMVLSAIYTGLLTVWGTVLNNEIKEVIFDERY